MANRYRRYIQTDLSTHDIRQLESTLKAHGYHAHYSGGVLHSSDIPLFVQYGQARYQVPTTGRLPKKLLGAHWIETGDDDALDAAIDLLFLGLLERSDTYVHCSHCHMHVTNIHKPVNVRSSLSCVTSLKLNDPQLYRFLSTASERELIEVCSSDRFRLDIPAAHCEVKFQESLGVYNVY